MDLNKKEPTKDTYLKTNASQIRRRGTFIHVSKQGFWQKAVHKMMWGMGVTRKTQDHLGEGIGKEVFVIMKSKLYSDGNYILFGVRKERKGFREIEGSGIKGTWQEACKKIRLKNKRAGWSIFREKAILAGAVS